MSDPTDPGGVTGSHERVSRNSARSGGSATPVGSPLSIALAVLALVAGFLIFRSISDDGNAAGGGLSGDVTTPATVPGGGTAPPAVPGQVTTPTPAATTPQTRSGATVVVANASATGQMAAPMSEQLAALGYTMGEPTSQAPGEDHPNLDTSIVYFSVASNSEDVARTLALDMGGLEVEPMPATPPTEGGVVDGVVLLMLGNDLAGDDVPGPPASTPDVPSVPTSASTVPT